MERLVFRPNIAQGKLGIGCQVAWGHPKLRHHGMLTAVCIHWSCCSLGRDFIGVGSWDFRNEITRLWYTFCTFSFSCHKEIWIINIIIALYYDVSTIYIYRNNLRYIDTAAYMISMQQATFPWSHALPMFSCQVTKALSMALRAMAAGLKGDGRSQGRWFCWSRPPASFPGGDLVIHLPSCFTRFTVTVAWLLWKRRFFFWPEMMHNNIRGISLRDFREFVGFYGQFIHILSMAREFRNGIPMDL